MKKSYMKKSFDRYINLLVEKSFGICAINEDFSAERKIPSSFKGDVMSGGKEFSTNFKRDAMSGNRRSAKIDAFPFIMREYKTEFESSENIDSFLHILKSMDDERMKKNIDILAGVMISAPPNTQANRDFEKRYKSKGITTKEQLIQAIYKEVMDRKNYRPDPNM